MNSTDIQNLVELLRHSELDYVRQALELSVVLPLFEWTADRLLQPSVLVSEGFTEEEIQFLKIGWLGHFLTTVQDTSIYDVAEILGVEEGELIVENSLPTLPNCWHVFQVETPFVLVLKMPNIQDLPLGLAEASAISCIHWKEGGCEIPASLWDMEIVWAILEYVELDSDNLEHWTPSDDIVDYLTFEESEYQWWNRQMVRMYWEYSNRFHVSYGSCGDCNKAYRLGTQSLLLFSLDFLTVSSMSPPSFVSASVENYEGSVRDYLATQLRDFQIGLEDISSFPHRVDELTRLLPHPEQMDVHVQEVLATGDATKEDYRQEVLNKLSELEQSIQAVKQQWRQW